jgi:hypothetical protein
MSDLIAADLLAEMGAALNERLDYMRAVDFFRAVTRKGVSAQEIVDLVRRHASLADESAGDNGEVGVLLADGWLQ